MAFTIYDASIPPLVFMLENLGHVLKMGEDQAREKGVDAKDYLENKAWRAGRRSDLDLAVFRSPPT